MSPPNLAHADYDPWLGIGLGFNNYTKADVNDLGNVWVYNWGAGNTHSNFPPTDDNTEGYIYSNNPDVDFEGRYVPTIYGCDVGGEGGIDDVFNWVAKNNYVGPMIVFNEPDNQTMYSCSVDLVNNQKVLNMAKAVNAVEYIVSKRDTYYANTGNYVDLLIGGTYASPNNNWDWWNYDSSPQNLSPWDKGFWFDLFLTEWENQHGTGTWPNVEGVHIHSYHLYAFGNQSAAYINALKENFTGSLNDPNDVGWNEWLDNHPQAYGNKNMVWITESGILDGTVSTANVNTVMNAILPFYRNNTPYIDRVAWYTHTTNNYFRSSNKNTSLIDNLDKTKTTLWNTYQDYCTDSQWCLDDNSQLGVVDYTFPNNLVTDYQYGNNTSNCPAGEWCVAEDTSNSRAFVQTPGNTYYGDLIVAADPGTGYDTCWVQWLNNSSANGETYRIKADFNSTFASGKSYIQVQTLDKENFLPFNSTWSTTDKRSIDQNVVIYGAWGGQFAIKFCASGTETLTDRKTAILQSISVTKVSDLNITVKDTAVTGNLITNDLQWDNIEVAGKWHRSYQNNNVVKNRTAITSPGKLRITSSTNTGNYGSCWIQQIQGGVADGSTYRLKAQVNSNTYSTYAVSIQLATQSTADYFYMNGSTSTIDETFTVTDASNPNYMAVKFCSSGTNTSPAGAILTKLSLEKIN